MGISDLKQELLLHRNYDLAFVIGNGVNWYAYGNDSWSWNKLLCKIWQSQTNQPVKGTDGIGMTELYDLLEIKTSEDVDRIRDSFISRLKDGSPNKIHNRIQDKIEKWEVPVLTTNFDHTLEVGYDRKVLKHVKDKYKTMSNLYPWDRYFSNQDIHDPSREYAVWHINGFVEFKKSIKLSSSEYVRQAAFTRKYLHISLFKRDDFGGKNQSYWRGYNTWLHTIFNCSLCIIGLGLNQDETFLRWLLIERKKYFDIACINHKGWYLYQKNEIFPEGKKLFMEGVGLQPISVERYEDIYEDLLSL